MRWLALSLALIFPILGAGSSAQLMGYEGGGGGAEAPAEREELASEVYQCLALDCQSLVARLGGYSVSDPLGDLVQGPRGFRGGRGSWLVGGPAPYIPVNIQMGGQGGFEPFRPEGLREAVALVEPNAIVLRGTPDAIDETLEFLRLIDQPAPMVRIELHAISTPEIFDRGNGLQWVAFGPSMQAGSQVGSLGAGANLSFTMGDIGMALNLFHQESRGYEDQTVSIMTESGLPAFIGVRNVEPSFIPVRGYDRFGNIVTTYDVIYSNLETSLLVLPRVNADNSVTMYLSPRFSRQVGTTGPPGGTGFPIIETLEHGAVVRAHNGQTIAIGGLRRMRVDNQWQGGPIPPGMIPEVRRTVMVENVYLFVTPYVYRPEDDPIPDIRM
jgi:type II secretory pathway component GspD/PulD (secretin)